jgi:hypothetical protein
MPTIEGLTNDDLSAYNTFALQLDDFVATYQRYISACNKNNNTCVGVNSAEVTNKLRLIGVNPDGSLDPDGSLAKYKQIINSHQTTDDTVKRNKKLQQMRAETQQNTEILTDLENSIEGDYVIKQASSHYYNAILYVGLACTIYFTFYQISSAK